MDNGRFKKGKSPWNKGLNKSDPRVAKYALGVSKSQLGRIVSMETRNKISKSHKGRDTWNKGKRGVYSEEHLKKLSIAHTGNKHSLGHVLWNKGKHWSDEAKEKMRQAHLGEKSYRYIKDRSKLKKSDNRKKDYAYKEWRKKIYNRDSHKCRLISSECKGRIEAHHIFGWTDYPELRYIENNGICVCIFHHPHGRKNEERMRPIFQELLLQ